MDNIEIAASEIAESSRNNEQTSSTKTNSKFTKRQWILLFVFAIMNVISTTTYGLQAPFYPAEAERKGASATEYGFVFGIFEFTVFVAAPIFGKYMTQLDPKRVFNLCTMVTSVAVISFGFLDWINDHSTFIALSLLCRFVEGFGCGGFLPAMFTIIACEFPDSTTTIFATLESFAGIGFLIGPISGAGLFSVGGFSLPFFSLGMVLFLSVFISSWVMPSMKERKTGNDQTGYGIWSILKIPYVAIASATLVSSTISMGYINAVLEPHIRQFGLTSIQMGSIFIINAGAYSIAAPICGRICDKIRKPIYILIIGNCFLFAAFLLIGPASFMPFDTKLWIIITGLILEGFGAACCSCAGFSVALKESLNNGFPDNMSTSSCVSGLWQSMVSFGAFSGPIMAGVLYDYVGFRQGSWLVLASSFSIVIITLLYEYISSHRIEHKKSEEIQPLLTPLKSANASVENSKSCSSHTLSIETYGSIKE